MRIRYQLALVVFVVGILGLAALTAYRAAATREILLARMETRAQAFAEVAEVLVAPALRRGDPRSLAGKLELLTRLPSVVGIQVFDQEGKLVASEQRRTTTDPKVSGSVLIPTGTEIVDAASQDVIGRVEVSVSKKYLQKRFQAQIWREVALGIIVTLALAAISWLIGTLMGRRLDSLVDIVNRIESGTPLKLSEGEGDSEVDRLSRAIRALNERLLSETAQRKKLEAFKDDLTNMLVHDMKHPITVLTSLLALLADEDQELVPKEKRDALLHMAKRSVKRENDMIEDLLQVARLSNPEMPLQKKRLSLAAFVAECASMNSLLVEQSQKAWALEIDGDMPACWIYGDAVVLKRLIGNLVLNAIEHSPPRSAITLGVRLSRRDHSKAEIFVRDQGPGVPAQRREAIFQKFRGFAESAKNVGLGLAFCKMAAEKHGARLELLESSEPGTTFALIIPVSAGPASGQEPGTNGLAEPRRAHER